MLNLIFNQIWKNEFAKAYIWLWKKNSITCSHMAVPCDMTIQLLGGCEGMPFQRPLGRSTYFNGSKVVVLLFFYLCQWAPTGAVSAPVYYSALVYQWLGSVQENVLKYKLFGCVTTCPSGRRLKISPSDYRKLVKVFRNDSETTKAQACHGTETAGIPASWLFSPYIERVPAMKKKASVSKSIFAAANNKPNGFWREVLWSNETKIKLFCHNEKRNVWGEARFSDRTTIYYRTTVNILLVVSYCAGV